MTVRRLLTLSICLLTCHGSITFHVCAQEQDVVRIEVSPPDVHLSGMRDFQTLIVQAHYADGMTRDVTADCSFNASNPSLIRIVHRRVAPLADGSCPMIVQYGEHSVEVPTVVHEAMEDQPISFRLDVMPVFMKAGCNMGSCHGAARGKDGFRLSLFGFDPAGDYFRLTREVPGRRINLATPDDCLLMAKATGAVPHSGGQRFPVDSESCADAATLVGKRCAPTTRESPRPSLPWSSSPRPPYWTGVEQRNKSTFVPSTPMARIAMSLRWPTSCRAMTIPP